MKKILILLVAYAMSAYSQAPVNKMSDLLQRKLNSDTNKELVWVFFKDKGKDLNKYYDSPESVVTKESLKRRAKVKGNNSLIDFDDLPVNSAYIKQVEALGLKVNQKTKWFNGVSGYADKNTIEKISNLSFVKNLDLVARLKRGPEISVQENILTKNNNVSNSKYLLNYGASLTQVDQINVPALHDQGINGQGIKIALFDAGFDNLSHECFSTMDIAAKWDFVNNDSVVSNQADSGEGSHGRMTLSTIGGYKEGQLIGPAYRSTYFLAKTENTDSETPIEENNWIAAVEWADSLGVDIISSSLGYNVFDAPWTSYTWENMNGRFCRSTLGAVLAMRKGIVVVNSAGNSGDDIHNTLGAPADADSIITAGAVSPTGERTSFSSVGPTSDGRIKPDVMAMGSYVRVAGYSNNSYGNASGTSFSCPLTAGVAALILCKNPNFTPVQVRDALRSTASRSNNPDKYYGWGIINALNAANYSTATNINSEKTTQPKDFGLFQNYPNPFNPSTTIRFSLPVDSKVKLSLYNIIGNEIKTLSDGNYAAGTHELKLDGSELPSGIYFVKMTAENFQQTIKITLAK